MLWYGLKLLFTVYVLAPLVALLLLFVLAKAIVG